MSNNRKNKKVLIGKFLGLNASLDGGSTVTLGEAEYMKNYRITSSYGLEKRPGGRLLSEISGNLRGLYVGTAVTEELLAVINSYLYRVDRTTGVKTLIGDIPGTKKVSFVSFYGSIYILTGSNIYKYDGTQVLPVLGYRPMIAVSTPPEGGGTPFEKINMLTGSVRQSFTPDATSLEYKFALDDIDDVDYILLNGSSYTGTYLVDREKGSVVFDNAIGETGPNSLVIGYTKDNVENYAKIVNCRFGTVFGGENNTKVFLYGNPSYPSTRFSSESVDGTASFSYFPETGATIVGDGQRITNIISHYDRQIIFTTSKAYYSYSETNTDYLGNVNTSYPVMSLSDTKGSIVENSCVLINNTPITVMPDGLYKWSSTNIRDERNAVNISRRISSLLSEADIYSIRLFDNDLSGEMFIISGGRVFVYNYALDVFYMFDNIKSDYLATDSTSTLFGADGSGIYKYSSGEDDEEGPIEATWRSGSISFDDSANKCALFQVSLLMAGRANNSCTVTVIPDNPKLDRVQIDFSADFSEQDGADIINDDITVPSVFETRRLRSRRWNSLRLQIDNNGAKSSGALRRILLKGMVLSGR